MIYPPLRKDLGCPYRCCRYGTQQPGLVCCCMWNAAAGEGDTLLAASELDRRPLCPARTLCILQGMRTRKANSAELSEAAEAAMLRAKGLDAVPAMCAVLFLPLRVSPLLLQCAQGPHPEDPQRVASSTKRAEQSPAACSDSQVKFGPAFLRGVPQKKKMRQVATTLYAFLACFVRSDASSPVVNYTIAYPDGSVLRAELVAADGSIVRLVVIPPGKNESFLRYPLTVPQPPLPSNASFIVKDSPSYALLFTSCSTLNISKAVPTTQLLSPSGSLLSAEPQPVSAEPELQCGNGHGGPIAGGCLRAWRSIQEGEGIFGFGMQSFAVDHVGTTKWIQTDANPSPEGMDHAPAPFFVSSLGYGYALNTHRYAYFDVGFAIPPSASGAGLNLIHSADPVVDGFFFAGPGPAAVLGQFTQLFGRPTLPPRAALGLWYHPLESSNQTAVEATVAAFAANGAALAAVTLEPPWQTHAYACTYVWSKGTFWDVPGFLASMKVRVVACRCSGRSLW
jgi:hypothetical protein